MNIAVIGGGITGLTAAYELTKRGQTVSVFEKDDTLGGLAGGFSSGSWGWKLEKTYHHFFTNDTAVISLAKKLGMEKDLMVLSPITSIFLKNKQERFDTPMNILKFSGLPFVDRLRTGMTAAIMKLSPFWQPLEHISAKKLFRFVGGDTAWNTIWEPLLDAKFGPYADSIAASWLWARLFKRTMRLGYFKGGFSHFVDVLVDAIKNQRGTIHIQYPISNIQCKKEKNHLSFIIGHVAFDAVLITTPSSIATKLIQFPNNYTMNLLSIPHLWAQTLIVETEKPLLEKTYWLNVNDRSFPFLAVVAHTNMIDKKHYGGKHITYIGNYLPNNHPFLNMTKEQLLKKFLPFLKKINNYPLSITNSYLFTVPNAQPVHTLNYSKRAPTIRTPIPNVYLANLDSIYPWDRGTNYAVSLGQKAAKQILLTHRVDNT